LFSYCISIDDRQSALMNYDLSPANQGGDDQLDSDAVVANTFYANIPVSAVSVPASAARPRTDLSFDFGFFPLVLTVRLGDRVFIDVNRNGIQDPGTDTFVAGVTVTLRPANGALTEMTTVTNGTGHYEFVSSPVASNPNSVRPNENYQLIINTADANSPLVNHQATKLTPPTGSEANDSNGVHLTRTLVAADATTGAPGTSDLTYDFGFIPIYTVGDKVFADTNGNGLQDGTPAEAGIRDVTVTLSGGLLPAPRTTVTEPDGTYFFTSLSPSDTDTWADTLQAGTTYVITVRPGEVPRSRASPPNQGMDDTVDSDGIPTPSADPTSVDQDYTSTGQTDQTRDFGFVPELRIGDYVWRDTDGNGQQTGELSNGLPSVVLTLYASNNVTILATTSTDADGLYFFSSFETPTLTPNRDVNILANMSQPALAGYVLFVVRTSASTLLLTTTTTNATRTHTHTHID
jgi:serine-aspartate repeat-containing protein C/D/E